MSKAARRVPEAAFNDLYSRLRRLWAVGLIEEQAYILGIHVLARMAKFDTLEIAAQLSDFVEAHVTSGSEVIAGPVVSNLFMSIGALQQLHRLVGLLSHYSQEGLEASIGEALENQGVGSHFSTRPVVAGPMIGASTLLIFKFDERLGVDDEKVYQMFQEKTSTSKMPTWVKMTKLRAAG